ncbi:MAG: L,D-transpeptidase family protein [Vicinamibacterales bacterium]
MGRAFKPLLLAGLALGLVACSERFAGDSSSSPLSSPAVVSAAQMSVADAIQETFASGRVNSPELTPEVAAFYEAQEFRALWLDQAGRPGSEAQVALKLILHADAEGLDPADYQALQLVQDASALATGQVAVQEAASFDVRLTAASLRYLRHVHHGRVSPKAFGYRLADRADEHNFPATLRSAVEAHRFEAEVASFAPQLQLYRNLKARLAEYRALAQDEGLTVPPTPASSVKPGGAYEGAAALQRLLVALGDLPPDQQPATSNQQLAANQQPATSNQQPSLYSPPLVAGVKHFQERHGLTPDGVLGRGTVAALQVPMAQRARQIELALERLRWLPHIGDGPLIGVNIPMFRMWAWSAAGENSMPDFEMGVIVGAALRTETPVFIEDMEFVTFRPYWNVPPSIVKGEILPAIERDSAYLTRHDMELVAGQSDAAKVVPASDENLARLEKGELRVRQRPGVKNSLGLMKFIFPNDDNVYMHGTPAPALFARERRDFSHGCIRVEDPVALAEWVLRDQGMDRGQIVQATQGEQPKTVKLEKPVQVVIFYLTAIVAPDGTLRFADDIYKTDAALDRALSD